MFRNTTIPPFGGIVVYPDHTCRHAELVDELNSATLTRMFSLFKKKSKDEPTADTESMQWDASATQALQQAVAQAPVPRVMKQQVKRQLQQAAEEYARNAGKTTVSPEDLMNGLMSRLPEHMRKKVEEAAKKGPEGLKDLEKEIQ